jgi:hypothetical protein
LLGRSLLAAGFLGGGSFIFAVVVLGSVLGPPAGSGLLCWRSGVFFAVFFLGLLLGWSAALLRCGSWNIVLLFVLDLLGWSAALLRGWRRIVLLVFILDLILLGLGCALLLGALVRSLFLVLVLSLLSLLGARLLNPWAVQLNILMKSVT